MKALWRSFKKYEGSETHLWYTRDREGQNKLLVGSTEIFAEDTCCKYCEKKSFWKNRYRLCQAV